MAVCAHVGSWKSVTTLPCVIVVLLLLVVQCPVPISATRHPKRPRKLTFYLHELRGTTMDMVTNTSLGFVAVVNQRLTEGALATSKHIGQEVGTIAQLGYTAEALYGSFDVQIQTDEYNGTFLFQGVFNLHVPVRTLAVVGGTGDFHLARGYATFSTFFAAPTPAGVPSINVTYLYNIHFKY